MLSQVSLVFTCRNRLILREYDFSVGVVTRAREGFIGSEYSVVTSSLDFFVGVELRLGCQDNTRLLHPASEELWECSRAAIHGESFLAESLRGFQVTEPRHDRI